MGTVSGRPAPSAAWRPGPGPRRPGGRCPSRPPRPFPGRRRRARAPPDGDGAELRRGERGQGPQEATDGGAGCTHDDDVTSHRLSLRLRPSPGNSGGPVHGIVTRGGRGQPDLGAHSVRVSGAGREVNSVEGTHPCATPIGDDQDEPGALVVQLEHPRRGSRRSSVPARRVLTRASTRRSPAPSSRAGAGCRARGGRSPIDRPGRRRASRRPCRAGASSTCPRRSAPSPRRGAARACGRPARRELPSRDGPRRPRSSRPGGPAPTPRSVGCWSAFPRPGSMGSPTAVPPTAVRSEQSTGRRLAEGSREGHHASGRRG